MSVTLFDRPAARCTFQPAFTEILFDEAGFYLVIKTDSRPESITDYATVRDSLRRRLLAEKRQVIEKEYFQQCVNAVEPQINRDVLATIKLEPEPKDAEPVFVGRLPAQP